MPLNERLSVVLVEPRFPGNLGSVARVMANTGFRDLVLIRPCPVDDPEARRMALLAYPILEGATVLDDLGTALCGFQYAVAATCRRGRLRDQALDPPGLARSVATLAPEARVALVFGPEDRGLSNEELTLCQAVVTIPTDPAFESLNLSHAVLVLLWELRSLTTAAAAKPKRLPAEAGELEGMHRHLERVLLEIGFLHRQNPGRIARVLRRMLNRAAPDKREVRIVRGLLRQFDWYLRRRTRKENTLDDPPRSG